MKWYGLFNNSLTLILHKKLNLIKKQKSNAILLNSKINLNFYKTILYVPNLWDILIFTKSNNYSFIYFYFYSKFYFFFITLSRYFLILKYDYQSKSILCRFLYNNNYFKIIFNYFKIIFFTFSKIFFKKLKFKGKGYYIFKNYRNTIALQFGYSHLLYVYSFFINIKFLSKTSVFMFGLNINNILKQSYLFFNLKPINVFTGKGIRFSRQILYRKTGKISSYR